MASGFLVIVAIVMIATITEIMLKILETVVAMIEHPVVTVPYDHNDCSTYNCSDPIASVVFVDLIFSLTNMHRAGAIPATENHSLLIKVCTNA